MAEGVGRVGDRIVVRRGRGVPTGKVVWVESITPILTFPRQGGRDKRGWIPAYAGMTDGEAGMAEGRSTLRQAQGEGG